MILNISVEFSNDFPKTHKMIHNLSILYKCHTMQQMLTSANIKIYGTEIAI